MGRKDRRTPAETARLREQIMALKTEGLTQKAITRRLRLKRGIVEYHLSQVRIGSGGCRECGRDGAIRARGLCGRCYADPKIVERYPLDRPANDGSLPSFAWSADPTLFPCDVCLRAAVAMPRALCPKCAAANPGYTIETARRNAGRNPKYAKESVSC